MWFLLQFRVSSLPTSPEAYVGKYLFWLRIGETVNKSLFCGKSMTRFSTYNRANNMKHASALQNLPAPTRSLNIPVKKFAPTGKNVKSDSGDHES